MRILLWILAVAVAAWSGYWAISAAGIGRALDGWLQDRRDEGWQAEGTVSVTGFPVAFRAEFGDLALADPATGLAWEAPRVAFAADAWAPTAVRATLPPAHVLSTPEERIEIAGEIAGALTLDLSPDLGLKTADIDLGGLRLASTGGWTSALDDGRLGLRRDPGDPLTQAVEFSAAGFRPADPVLARLDPAGLAPERIDEMTVRATVGFDRPWDRRAIEERRPQPRGVALERLRAVWGRMELEAAGTLTVDEAGIPEGRITVRAVNWRDMVALARSSGALPEAIAPTVERALELLAGMEGNPETLDAPLTFARGRVSFGPLPLGPAPRLTLR